MDKKSYCKYDFLENQDFSILKIGNGNNANIEYIVTLDMANELPVCEFENGVSFIQRLTFADLF